MCGSAVGGCRTMGSVNIDGGRAGVCFEIGQSRKLCVPREKMVVSRNAVGAKLWGCAGVDLKKRTNEDMWEGEVLSRTKMRAPRCELCRCGLNEKRTPSCAWDCGGRVFIQDDGLILWGRCCVGLEGDHYWKDVGEVVVSRNRYQRVPWTGSVGVGWKKHRHDKRMRVWCLESRTTKQEGLWGVAVVQDSTAGHNYVRIGGCASRMAALDTLWGYVGAGTKKTMYRHVDGHLACRSLEESSKRTNGCIGAERCSQTILCGGGGGGRREITTKDR